MSQKLPTQVSHNGSADADNVDDLKKNTPGEAESLLCSREQTLRHWSLLNSDKTELIVMLNGKYLKLVSPLDLGC